MSWNVIDVSRYQGNIDFAKVKASGISGVILRAGIGSYSTGAIGEDSKFIQNITLCNNVGLPVGLYYFTQANTESEAIAEADFLIERAKKYNVKLPLVFDIENAGRITSQSKAQRTRNAIAFCKRIKEAGYEPLVYTYRSFFDSMINESEIKAQGYGRWVAHYTSAAHPEYETEYVMWQYSSTGSVPGIEGNVDMNHCYKNYFSGGGNKVTFTKRTTAPSTTDKNWINVNYGGKNHALTISRSTGSVLPNCTGYCHGRWLELGLPENKLCLYNADQYFGYTRDGFTRGQTPKLGAIVCWKCAGKMGHVAVVEEIYSDGTILASQSNYGGTKFYTKRFNPNTWPSGYVFQGYIYSPIDFENGGSGVGTPVARDKYRNQIEIVATTLRARSSPTTSKTDNVLGVVNTGIFNVYANETADGYVWTNIEEGVWIATKEGEWTNTLPAQSLTPARLKIGPASSGDRKTIEAMLKEKQIPYTVSGEYITTSVVSSGDKKSILIKCDELKINCIDYVEDDSDDEEKIKQLEQQVKDLQAEVKTQQSTITTLEQSNAKLTADVNKLSQDNTTLTVAVSDVKTIVNKF